MLIKRLYFIATALLAFSICSCGESYPDHPWEWDQETEEEESNPDIVSQGWTTADNFGSLPDYIHIYKSPENLAGKKAIAYIAVADMSKAKFEVLGDIAFSQEANGYGGKSIHTPSEFYESSKAPVVINGGLFFYSAGFYYSQNLVIREGQLLAPNQNYYSKDWVTMWYPAPADNDINKDPLQAPSSTFPNGAKALEATTGIGGVTVLLRAGEIKNTYVEEMLDISAASNQPRTAIGITTNKKMIIFVCEGRNMTEGVAGLTTANVAKVMKDLGCTEALNLDGGGSSCMLVNGKETIKGSDGKQRKVLTAVGIK